MPSEIDPIVNQWYRHLDKGQNFLVTAVDKENGVVEVQHFDGDLEEISLADWYQLDLDIAEAPENWSGPLDVGDAEDLESDISDTADLDWNDSLEEIKPTPSNEE